MIKPLVVGMGPPERFDGFGWHPAAATTRALCWATLGTWDCLLDLEAKVELTNLNKNYFGVEKSFRGRVFRQDQVDDAQAKQSVRNLLFKNSLVDLRRVVLLGEAVTNFVAKELGKSHILQWHSPKHRAPSFTRVEGEKDGFYYCFEAITAYHPSNMCGGRPVTFEQRDAVAVSLRSVMRQALGQPPDSSPVSRIILPLTGYPASYNLLDRHALEARFGTMHPSDVLVCESTINDFEPDAALLSGVDRDTGRYRHREDESFNEVEGGVIDHLRNEEEGWFYSDSDEEI